MLSHQVTVSHQNYCSFCRRFRTKPSIATLACWKGFHIASDIVFVLLSEVASLHMDQDINEQFRVNPRQHPIPWALLKGLGLKHRLSPSALTYLSYHHHGATPLMFSLMAGKFESTLVLLKAGASLELRNSRGKTAQDILEETKAPISLAQEVLSDCDSEDTVCI